MDSVFQVLQSDLWTSFSFLLLALSIVSQMASPKSWLWKVALVLALGLAAIAGRVGPWALVHIFTVLFVGKLYVESQRTPFRWIGLLVLSAVLFVAVLPVVRGFENWLVLRGVRFTEDALPYSFWLGFEKPVIGLLLYGYVLKSSQGMPHKQHRPLATVAVGVMGIIVTIALAFFVGYVRWAPKFSDLFWFWALRNLLFTCFGEEVLFRGLLQGELAKLLDKFRYGSVVALAVSALAFGLAHIGGGWTYVGLSTVAGIFYGWVYLRTRSVGMSVGLHFCLNTIHFLFLTYPALA